MHESEKCKWSRSVMSDPQRPHGLQPSRLLHPWDFPDKSTGVGCHCLLRLYGICSSINIRCLDSVCVCVCVCVCAQSLSCVQLFETPQTVYTPPGSSVHGFLQTGILERVAICSSRGSSWTRDWSNPCLFCLLHCKWILYLLTISIRCLVSRLCYIKNVYYKLQKPVKYHNKELLLRR